MHMLENPPKAHSVFGKTSRTNSAIFVEVAKCNQLHPGAAWGTLERSQAEISMARIRLWEISGKMTKIDFLKLRSPFQGTLPATGGGGWGGNGGEVTWFSSEKQGRMDCMMNPRDKPYLQEAGYLGGSQEEESLKFA